MSSTLARRLAAGRHGRRPERGTVVLISVLLGFESVLYSAVTPVLPHYAHQFGASKPAIGVLAAAYPAGMLPGSLIGWWIATRAGVRRTTVVGLVLFTVSIVAFGFGSSLAALDSLRFVQGIACGCIWGGGLAWVIAIAPRERRGEILGSVLASAIFGTLLGPILGTLAVAVGTRVVFASVGGVALALTAWTLNHPEPPPARLGAGAPLRALVRSRRLMLGFWLILLEASTIGAMGTLLPLRLSRFGASGVAIGVTFVVASLMSTLLAPAIGRVIDRRGLMLPLVVGLGATAVLLALLPLPQSALGLAVFTAVTYGGPLTCLHDAGDVADDGRGRAHRRCARVRLNDAQCRLGAGRDSWGSRRRRHLPDHERCGAARVARGGDAPDARTRIDFAAGSGRSRASEVERLIAERLVANLFNADAGIGQHP